MAEAVTEVAAKGVAAMEVEREEAEKEVATAERRLRRPRNTEPHEALTPPRKRTDPHLLLEPPNGARLGWKYRTPPKPTPAPSRGRIHCSASLPAPAEYTNVPRAACTVQQPGSTSPREGSLPCLPTSCRTHRGSYRTSSPAGSNDNTMQLARFEECAGLGSPFCYGPAAPQEHHVAETHPRAD